VKHVPEAMTTPVVADRKAPFSSRASIARTAICLIVLTLLASVIAYYDAFSSMAEYDDEGLLATNVKRFMDGAVLYDQTGSIYGPVYYLYQLAAHRLAGAAITHDSVRWITMAFWLTTSALCFLLVHRTTRSLLAAALAQVLTFRALAFLGIEPAHPQEACILLLALLGLQACFARNKALLMVSLGSLAAAIVLTKANLGACVLLGLSMALLSMLKEGRSQRAGLWLACVAAIAFPVILMRGRLGEQWVAIFCIVEVLSVISVILVVVSLRIPAQFRWRDVMIAVLAFVAASIAISSFVFARGTTPAAMLKWLIIWPATTFLQGWSLPPPTTLWEIPSALLSLAVAWQFWIKRRSNKAIIFLKAGFVIAVLWICMGDGHYSVVGFVIPFLWLVAVPPSESLPDGLIFGRVVLATLAVLQILYAYPIAGSQYRLITVFMILGAVICLSDVSGPIRALLPLQWRRMHIDRWAGAALLLLLAAFYLAWARGSRAVYVHSTVALHLPGSNRMHLRRRRAMALQQLVSEARRSCTSLVTVPGMYSFNLWTDLPYPDQLTSENWMESLTDLEDTEIRRELSHEDHACVIYNPKMASMWNYGDDLSSSPLLQFIKQQFPMVMTANDYQLMRRN